MALACSNLQENFDVPTVVSAIVAREDSVSQLEKLKVPKKNRKSTLSEIRARFEDIEPLLYDAQTVELPENSWDPSSVGFAYVSILDNLLDNLFENNLLRYVATIKTITFRNGVVTPGFDYALLPSDAQEQLKKRAETIRPLDDKSNDVLLRVAQHLAMMRYEELKESSPGYTISRIRKNPLQYFQVLRMSYPGPLPDDFSGYSVGIPTLAIRDVEGSLSYKELRHGTQIDYVPALRFCSGNQWEGASVPCSTKNNQSPFGSTISQHVRDERCPSCRKGKEYVDCLSRRPSCDGLKVVCGNEEFAAFVCTRAFGLYVTRFADTLKVGNAYLPNLIGRLLYQGANSALLLYPFIGIENAWLLEGQLAEFLSAHLSSIAPFGVERVQRTAPRGDEKLSEFCGDWNRSDALVLESVQKIISSAGRTNPFARAETKIVSFLANYLQPSSFLLDRAFNRKRLHLKPWVRSKGRVAGYRGSFLFLEGGNVLDAKMLRGFVVEAPP